MSVLAHFSRMIPGQMLQTKLKNTSKDTNGGVTNSYTRYEKLMRSPHTAGRAHLLTPKGNLPRADEPAHSIF